MPRPLRYRYRNRLRAVMASATAAVMGPGCLLPTQAQARAVAPASVKPIRLALIDSLSGPFGNAGEAVWRNLCRAVEPVNAHGGVRLPGAARPLELQRFDRKGAAAEQPADCRMIRPY